MRSRSSILLSTTSAAALLGVVLGASLVAPPVQAEKVGVAAAVNPDAFSSMSDAPQKQLNIGKSIFYNERINTTSSGLVQVLLVDGSTFTVGPGSDLVIDRFVYDPRKQTGKVVASFSKGVMRYVGGKISKNEGGVTIKTPAGALAIRGGMVQGNGKIWSLLYGVEMVWKGKNGQTVRVYQPGYTLDLTGGTPKARPTTAADTKSFMAALSSGGNGGTGTAGSDPGNPPPKQALAETISLQDLVSDATGDKVTDTIASEEKTPPNDNTPPPPITPDDPGSPESKPEPTQVTMRVLVAPGTYTAFPGLPYQYTTYDGAEQGILGGDDLATVDDFVRTFTIENDRVVGTVSGLVDSSEDGTEAIAPANVNFPAAFPVSQCGSLGVGGVCAVTDATVTQDGETKTYQGLAVLRPDFVGYHLVNTPDQSGDDHAEPILAFGGKGYNFGTPSGKTYAFQLTPDVLAAPDGALGPFASGESWPETDPDKPSPSISPLLYLEKDSNPQSKAVWLQTNLYIKTTPADEELEISFDQESFVNVALGGVQNGGLVGARRGGSHVDIPTYCQGSECSSERESFAFTGDIASFSGPDGSHFLGKDEPNVVIGIDSTGTHNIGRNIPLDPDSSSIQNQSGATYHIGVGLGALQPQSQTLDGTYQGYATGMVESDVPENNFTNVLASESPEDFSIAFNKTTNTLSANLTVKEVPASNQVYNNENDDIVSAYEFEFGDDGGSAATRSAYIDDLHYGAIEGIGTSATTVLNNDESPFENAASTGYLVSAAQVDLTKFFPETFGNPEDGVAGSLCNDCDFLQWGAWGSRVEFGDNSNPSEFVDNIHLGFWVAGDVTDVDALAALGGSASYEGHAIGNVASRIDSNRWTTYVATGDLGINWNFADRAGDLTISKFDQKNFDGGLTFAGPISQPNPDAFAAGKHFEGNITGQNLPQNLGSLTGNAAGSFVGPVLNNAPPPGVMGNWNVGGNNYKATGIFGGVRQ